MTRKPLPADVVLPREQQDIFFRITLESGQEDIYIHSYEAMVNFINLCMEGQGPFSYIKSITHKAWDDEKTVTESCPDCLVTYTSNGRCSCDL